AEILNQTDVLVAPSIWYENSPIAIMEALTTGTPVVTAYLSWDIRNNGRSSV
ncbi:MAG: glycosyltransferase, partial [Anaerolineae bacterium]|nr:glycosyltransferase [Anaerolineae bacterium]